MLCSILVTSMVLSLVQGQASPAPSSGTPGTPSKPDGQVTCDFNIEGSDPAIKQECPWMTECSENENKTLSGCLRKGNTVCNLYQYIGSGPPVATNLPLGCHPTETCCDGKCCSETQTCVYQQGPSDAEFVYDFMTLSVEDVARNNWKTPKGEPLKHYPSICVDTIFSADSGSKALFTPMVAMVLLLATAFEGFRRTRYGLFNVTTVTTSLVVVTCFFIMFSQGWVFALLTTLVASATMAWPDDKKGLLVILHLLFLWLYFGGNQILFQEGSTMHNFFHLAQGSNIEGPNGLEAQCATFYDYYTYHPGDKNWATSPTRMTWGICGREWLGYLVVLSYMNAFAVFTMVTHNFHEYLAPTSSKNDNGDGNSSDLNNNNTPNPLEGVTEHSLNSNP